MDQFDFSAPVNVTVIFDDSDDETFETKPSLQDFKIENETITNDSSKEEQFQDIEKQAKDVVLIPVYNTSKTETHVLDNYELESTIREPASNMESTTEKTNKHALQKKTFDMTSLREENSTEMIGTINESNKNEKAYTNNYTNSERVTSKKKKTVSKRNLTEELSNSDKTCNAKKKTAKIKKIFKKRLSNDIDPTSDKNKNVTLEKISAELNPTVGNNGTQNQDSNISVYSKYFVNCNQDRPNKEITPIESHNRNFETEKTFTINVEINPSTQPIDQGQSNLDKSYQSLNEFNKTVSNSLKGLLDTVSEHMIHILNSYQSYVNLYHSYTDPRLIENSKNNYISTRNHFFDLSYSSVVNIIIPRNKEPTFVTNFLTNTVQIGHSKSFDYTYEQIKPLYSDMIAWVQKRQVQIQNMNIHKVSSPKLLQELQKPLSRSSITHQNQQVQKQSPVSKKDSTQSRQPRENIYESPQLQNSIAQNKPQSPYSNQNQQYLESSALNGYCFQSSRSAKQSIIGPTHWHQQEAHREHYEYQIPSTYSKHNALQKPINDRLQQMQSQITNIQTCPNYSNKVRKVTLHQNPGPSYQNSVGPKQSSHTRHNDVLPSFTQNFQQHYQERMLPQYNNQLLQPENTTQVESNRSSISRDSGFISPLNFNINNDVAVLQLQEEQTTTPLITHVTSLNPNVSLIKDGTCAVCGKVTKQKCLGCFNSYYCSHSCQFLDWKIHQFICKQQKM